MTQPIDYAALLRECAGHNMDFDPERHEYTKFERLLPSVTQIMKPLSLQVYEDIPPAVMEIAADRGTRAHDQISNIVRYGINETDPDTEGYIEGFLQFVTDRRPLLLESEYRAWHKNLQYAGTVDLIGFIEPDNGAGVDVIDIKTTAQHHPVMVGTQTSAYGAILLSWGIHPRAYYALHLKNNGTYGLYQMEDRFKTFLHCLAIHNEMAAERREKE